MWYIERQSEVNLVVYRDFGDGSDELGVLTFENGRYWVKVGNWDYHYTIFDTDFPWTIIGPLC
jgi:hypothetical protein